MQKKKTPKKPVNRAESRQKNMLRIMIIAFSILIILSMVLTSISNI